MKHSNFTIFRKLSQSYQFTFRKGFFSFIFMLTMLNSFSTHAKAETVNMELFLSSSQETCQGSSDGSVSVVVAGGTPQYSYLWNTGHTTDIVYNLTSGTYTVTVIDSQGETATNSVDVELSPEGLWIITSTTADADCGSNGIAHVGAMTGTPPYTYQWDDPAMQTTEDAINLSPGIYHITVTDSNGCTAIDSTTIGGTLGISITTTTIQDAGCGPNGIAHVDVIIGTPPYSYLWSGGQTTSTANNLYFGTYSVTVTDSNGCTAVGSTTIAGEDGTSIGDYVFLDGNEDGIQQIWEPGVDDVYVALHSAGPDGNLYTGDDVQEDWKLTGNNGHYLFDCVDPGLYYIRFAINTDVYTFSLQYQGNNANLDSNADPVTGFTESFTVFQGMADDLSYDAGVYYACDDFTYGGTIGDNQFICPGDIPATLHTVIPPSGGSGTPEYLWLKSTGGGSFPNPSWMEIPNSNTENYNPGPLNVTTYFIRCIRRAGCNTFLIESANQVTITVLPSNHEFCTGGIIDPFESDPTADIIATENVMVKWTTGPEDELYNYYVQRAIDGVNFSEIAMVHGYTNNNSSNNYHFMDTEPEVGRNVYRIRRLTLNSGVSHYSNRVEVFFISDEQSFMVHPNPVSNVLKVEASMPSAGKTPLKLYNTLGQLLDVVEMVAGETSVEINMRDYSTGLYFIHIPENTQGRPTILKVLKN